MASSGQRSVPAGSQALPKELVLLKVLSTAPSLTTFLQHARGILDLERWALQLAEKGSREQRWQRLNELPSSSTQLLWAAVCRGLQLITEQVSQGRVPHSDAVNLWSNVVSPLTTVAAAWRGAAPNQEMENSVCIKLHGIAQKTGLPAALASAAPALATAWQHQYSSSPQRSGQQQQQKYHQGDWQTVASASHYVMMLWCNLAGCWNSPDLAGSAVAAAVPMARLAAAVLWGDSSTCDAKSSSGSRATKASSDSSRRSIQQIQEAWGSAMSVAEVLSCVVYFRKAAACPLSTSMAAVAGSSQDIQQLLLLRLASGVQLAHNKTRGLSPVKVPAAAAAATASAAAAAELGSSSRQQGQQLQPKKAQLSVPPYHHQLLQALSGDAAKLACPGVVSVQGKGLSVVGGAVVNTCISIMSEETEQPRASSGTPRATRGASSSSSSSSPVLHQLQPQLVLPLLFTLLEALLLEPPDSLMSYGHIGVMAALAESVASCNLHSSSSGHQTAALAAGAELLSAVLGLLVPVVQYGVKRDWTKHIPDLPEAMRGGVGSQTLTALGRLVNCLACQVLSADRTDLSSGLRSSQALAPVARQHPLNFCTFMESGYRVSPLPQPQFVTMFATSCVVARALSLAAEGSAGGFSGAAAAAAVAGQRHSPAPQLFSLLVTLLKVCDACAAHGHTPLGYLLPHLACMMSVAAGGGRPTFQTAAPAGMAGGAGMTGSRGSLASLARGSGSSSSTSASDPANSNAEGAAAAAWEWPVVVARCLSAMGRVLAAALDGQLVHAAGEVWAFPTSAVSPKLLLAAILEGVEWVGSQLPAALGLPGHLAAAAGVATAGAGVATTGSGAATAAAGAATAGAGAGAATGAAAGTEAVLKQLKAQQAALLQGLQQAVRLAEAPQDLDKIQQEGASNWRGLQPEEQARWAESASSFPNGESFRSAAANGVNPAPREPRVLAAFIQQQRQQQQQQQQNQQAGCAQQQAADQQRAMLPVNPKARALHDEAAAAILAALAAGGGTPQTRVLAAFIQQQQQQQPPSGAHFSIAPAIQHGPVLGVNGMSQQQAVAVAAAAAAASSAAAVAQGQQGVGVDPSDVAAALTEEAGQRALLMAVSKDLAVQLQQFGAAVCAQLPLRHCCNNPSCTNLAQPSEMVLANSKGSVCSGCRAARYCGRACQLAHWGQHKAVCKRLAKQAAAGKQ